ncbi:MAG: ABC transporter substrate-binding protein [Rhodospirillaceae bacterium]|nr:ABC transporter substrate-binding protein [Rhodospirillales bacterium]
MLRRLIAVLSLFTWGSLALGGAAHALPAGSGANDPSIVIGVVATLTGPGALAGQDLVDGFNLALKQLGGRFSNQEVRVVLMDDKGSPDMARQQVRRLMDRERLDMVLTGVSAPSLAAIIKPLIDARLFVLNLDQAPPAMAGADCSPWLFSLAASTEGLHEAMGQYLVSEHMRRVVVVGPQTGMTADAVAALKRTFPGEVTAVLSPRPGATTFADELARIAQIKPDAIYSLLTGGMGGGFVRAWGASPLKGEVPLFPLWPAVERQMLAAMGDAAQDLVSIGTWGNDLDSVPNRRLIADFEVEFGRPPSTWAAQGYDAAFLVDSALKATNGKTSNDEALRTALRRADFVSVRGSFKFNTNHFPVQSYYLRKISRDLKGRPTHEMRGVVLKDWRDRQAQSCPMRWVEEPLPVPVKK